MRLYHHPMSFNARRAVMTAIHLGTAVDLVEVDLGKREQRAPEFLRMNPNGRVPVLEHDGFHLSESHAIMEYLADLTPGQTVLPSAPRDRADVVRWLFWSAHHWSPAVSVFNWENSVKPFLGLGAPDPRELERGERLVAQCAEVLDAHLRNATWIAQGRLTLADLAIASPLMVTARAKVPVQRYAHLQAWFARVQELEAWRKTNAF